MFEYTYYWDTLHDKHEFLRASWEKSTTVPDSVLSQAHRLVQSTGKTDQIRIHRTMTLASHRSSSNLN